MAFLPTPPRSIPAQTAAPDRPKLRNSCEACATSKLKCSQEKPTCARCAKRGFPCEYKIAKRGGRKAKNRSNNTSRERGGSVSSRVAHPLNKVDGLAWEADWFASSTDSLNSQGTGHLSHEPSSCGSSDMLMDFYGSMDQTMAPAPAMESDNSLDNFFANSMSYPMPAIPDASNMFDTGNLFANTHDGMGSGPGSFSNSLPASDVLPEPQGVPIPEEASFDLPALSTSTSTPQSFSSFTRELPILTKHNTQPQDLTMLDSDPPCSCLTEALGLMKDVSSSFSNASTSQPVNPASLVPIVEIVIAQNKLIIENLSSLLDCKNSHDRYLLAVMSLIIFKMLDRYTTAARNAAGLQAIRSRQSSLMSEQALLDNFNLPDNYDSDGDDLARLAAQLTLSELHHVRRVIDRLSSRMAVQAETEGGVSAESLKDLGSDIELTLPSSSVMYDQLDIDLRKRLRALSREMIDRLKRL